MKVNSKKENQAALEKYKEHYKTGNYQKALIIIQPLAEKGDARAQYNLGVHYELGQGVEQNDDLAAA